MVSTSNPKTEIEEMLVAYHIRDSIFNDLVNKDNQGIKEKLKVLLNLSAPANMSLIPLSKAQIQAILEAHGGQKIKMGSVLEFDIHEQAEVLNVVSLFGLPYFNSVTFVNAKDFSAHIAAIGRILSLAINRIKPIGVGISGDATFLRADKGHTRIKSIVFDTDKQFIRTLEMC